MKTEKFAVVVPWHQEQQRDKFIAAWHLGYEKHPWLIFEQDKDKSGCAVTKNRGIRKAIDSGADIIAIIDDDCFPSEEVLTRGGLSLESRWISLEEFAEAHVAALQPQEVELFRVITDPPSRGTPYYRRSAKMPVAASIGFWQEVPDLCAPAQLVRGPLCPMTFDRRPVFGQPFAYCGMNVAFRAKWWPWCSFADLQRVDDIFAGYIFQRQAYRLGHCFNLGGPMVRHSRQSNVWRNLEEEVKYLERNETLWSDIMFHPSNDYEELCKLLPNKK